MVVYSEKYLQKQVKKWFSPFFVLYLPILLRLKVAQTNIQLDHTFPQYFKTDGWSNTKISINEEKNKTPKNLSQMLEDFHFLIWKYVSVKFGT